jgi:hypothetical protein
MIIRKISVGVDPLKAMHFQVGSSIMNGSHDIQYIELTDFGYQIWIRNGANEVLVWKTISLNMPVIIEHNLEF